VFLSTTPGPLRIIGIVYSVAVVSVGFLFITSLFAKSNSRVSGPLVVLLGGALVPVGLVFLGVAGAVPVEGYNHTVFGIVAFDAAAFVSIFHLGLFDVDPIARNTIFTELDDPIIVLDDQGRVSDVNPAASAVVPALEAHVGEPLETVAPPLEAVATAIEANPYAPSYPDDPIELPSGSDATPSFYIVQISAMRIGSRIVGHAIQLNDVTELRAKRQEVEAQNRRLDEFAGTVSHDLRNPLNVATGYVDLLEAELESGDYDSEAGRIERIDEAHERMYAIIDELLSIAREGETVQATEPLEFESIVDAAVRSVDTGDEVVVIDGAGTIHADENRLRSVLENLIRNAIDHSPGAVRIRICLTPDGLFVEDDGPGVGSDVAAHIFEHGYTTAAAGTGRGLFIVKSLVDSHGWEVALASNSEEPSSELDRRFDGACFVITGVRTEMLNGKNESDGGSPTV